MATILKQSSPKPMMIYGLLLPFIGEGLLISKGKKWARDRRLLTNAFHFNILQEYTPKLQDCCQVFVEKLQQHTEDPDTQQESFDFSQACGLLTLDVMLRCTMGLDSNCQLQDSEYTRGVQAITECIFQRGISGFAFLPDLLYFMTKEGQLLRSLCKMCHDFTSDIIEKRRKRLEESGELEAIDGEGSFQPRIGKGEVDFLDILLTVRDEDGSGLSDVEIRDQVDTFLFEGTTCT